MYGIFLLSFFVLPNDRHNSPLYLLGYIPAHNRVYLADKDLNLFGYSLSLNVVEYQTAVLRGDTDAADEILPTLPTDQLNKVARFLEGRGTDFIRLLAFSHFKQTFHQTSKNLRSR